MPDPEHSHQSLHKSIRSAQRKHKALLGKVEKSAQRLERRKAKLLAIEARIADLERRLAEPHRQYVGAPDETNSQLKRAQLIFNPNSGKHDGDSALRVAHIAASLRAHGIWAQIGIKTCGKDARGLALEAAQSGWPLVVVAAGDGTIEDVASQLIGTSTVLGIIPLGTMNNVARSLGIPLEIDEACALIGMGTVRHIDMGRVFSSDNPKVEYFLEAAGVGLGSLATLAGQAAEKKRWHISFRALRKMAATKRTSIRVQMDDVVVEAATSIVTVSNAPLMGRNLLVAPEAKMDDGYLDVAVYDGMGEIALVNHLKCAANGRPEKLQMYRARKVSIAADNALPANVDKVVLPQRRILEIEVIPRAVSVIVGNGIGLSVPVEAAPEAPTFAETPKETNGVAEGAKSVVEPAPGV
jgi:YegS/Rv2252/BmrU family lipid kinase